MAICYALACRIDPTIAQYGYHIHKLDILENSPSCPIFLPALQTELNELRISFIELILGKERVL